MAQKPSIPKGTRDFSPTEMAKRNYIFDTVKSVFKLYGFQQIETPAMENLSTLMGKYGEEGDKLLFKILNSGDYMSAVNPTELIQPVWRADRPQKGRYREFYQCDVDIIGSVSLLNEVELIQIVDNIFRNLGINVVLKINNRKILAGIAETIGEADRIIDITVAIDKLDKIGLDKVNEELMQKGVAAEAILKLQPILQLSGNNEEKLDQIEAVIGQSEIGMKGIAEMRSIFDYLAAMAIETEIELDLTLARGLSYYTGAIFEVKAKDVQIGSITGGGRYDDLTGIFGLQGVSGVGISFGADRIYDVMSQLGLFPQDAIAATQVMFVNFGETEERYCLPLLSNLRAAGISSEIYPDSDKMKKQMNYANRKGVKYVALAGESEIAQGMINLKNMETGDQQLIKAEELVGILREDAKRVL